MHLGNQYFKHKSETLWKDKWYRVSLEEAEYYVTVKSDINKKK